LQKVLFYQDQEGRAEESRRKREERAAEKNERE